MDIPKHLCGAPIQLPCSLKAPCKLPALHLLALRYLNIAPAVRALISASPFPHGKARVKTSVTTGDRAKASPGPKPFTSASIGPAPHFYRPDPSPPSACLRHNPDPCEPTGTIVLSHGWLSSLSLRAATYRCKQHSRPSQLSSSHLAALLLQPNSAQQGSRICSREDRVSFAGPLLVQI